jgi:tripeptide aminopeptidase
VNPREAAEVVVGRTIELAAVAAPPLQEQERARLVTSWWRIDGLHPTVDAVGNVRARLRDGPGNGLVICAHLDTVFGRDTHHGVHMDGERLYGPSVGDDSVAVAALSLLDELLPEEVDYPVWIVATVGEEGLGNLVGARHLLLDPPQPLRGVIAVEGNYLGRVVHSAVGSIRWNIVLEGRGGHAWEASGSPSALHELAKLIVALDEIDAQTAAHWSLNVGLASGGEAINARARHAEMQVDLRSEDADVLGEFAATILDLVEKVPNVRATAEEIGNRPAGSISAKHGLVRAAIRGLESVGRQAEHPSASTDANAAYDVGIPAVTIGITIGSGEHTPGEWIDIPPIEDGLRALAETIVVYQQEEES